MMVPEKWQSAYRRNEGGPGLASVVDELVVGRTAKRSHLRHCSKKIIKGIYNAFEGCHWYSGSVQIIKCHGSDCAYLRQLASLTNGQR
jgi:hypothetical protein